MRIDHAKQLYDLLGDAIADAEASGRDEVAISYHAAQLDDAARAELDAAIQEADRHG